MLFRSGFAEKQLEPLPVFKQLTEQAANLTEKSGKLFGERKADALDNAGQPFDKKAEQATDDRTRRPLKTALRRLDHILESISEKPKPMPMGEKPMGGPMPQMPGGEGEPPMKPPGGVPPLAQLKALRAIQAEVNERTAALAKLQPDKEKLNDADREELDELEMTQREVAELLEKIAPDFQPPPADPEKK